MYGKLGILYKHLHLANYYNKRYHINKISIYIINLRLSDKYFPYVQAIFDRFNKSI